MKMNKTITVLVAAIRFVFQEVEIIHMHICIYIISLIYI